MPRVSLPASLKNLKTYEVLLTQTTEAELKSYFSTRFAVFEVESGIFKKRIYDVVGEFLDCNPYNGNNWKKHPPTRTHQHSIAWFGDNEDEFEKYFKIPCLLSDLKLLQKHFKWEELEDWICEVESYLTYIQSHQDDLNNLEEMRFMQSKTKFESENKEWIAEQLAIKKHKQNHHSPYILFCKQEDGENIDEFLLCGYCKTEFDKETESIRKAREYTATSKLTVTPDPTIVSEPELSNEVEPRVEQVCEDCGYKTRSKSNFTQHLNSSEHKRIIKLKSWYCEVCEVQSRTELEHLNHMQTKKHETKVNGRPELVCEKCNYKTFIKQRYVVHCSSKKHIE